MYQYKTNGLKGKNHIAYIFILIFQIFLNVFQSWFHHFYRLLQNLNSMIKK